MALGKPAAKLKSDRLKTMIHHVEELDKYDYIF
jgi:hypothetical protein